MDTNPKVANELILDGYLRTRLSPTFGDYYYLCLSDLLMVLKQYSTEASVKILDYGCGGSPYRSLFPNAEYLRADIEQADGDHLDYKLDVQSNVKERDESFDLIFSSQVAEHVSHPQNYFSECFRLLKPGGRLICSTHGYFPDHGCPFDFQRWTVEGLRRDIGAAGFEIESVLKLTTGSRAFFSILDFSMSHLDFRDSYFFGIATYLFKKAFGLFRASLYRYLDSNRPNERVIDDITNKYPFYIGVFAVAVKAPSANLNSQLK